MTVGSAAHDGITTLWPDGDGSLRPCPGATETYLPGCGPGLSKAPCFYLQGLVTAACSCSSLLTKDYRSDFWVTVVLKACLCPTAQELRVLCLGGRIGGPEGWQTLVEMAIYVRLLGSFCDSI